MTWPILIVVLAAMLFSYLMIRPVYPKLPKPPEIDSQEVADALAPLVGAEIKRQLASVPTDAGTNLTCSVKLSVRIEQ